MIFGVLVISLGLFGIIIKNNFFEILCSFHLVLLGSLVALMLSASSPAGRAHVQIAGLLLFGVLALTWIAGLAMSLRAFSSSKSPKFDQMRNLRL